MALHLCLPCDASNSEHQAEKPPSPLIGTLPFPKSALPLVTGGGGWWIVRRLLEKRADSGVLKRAMLSVETPKRARSSILTKSFFSDCTATGPGSFLQRSTPHLAHQPPTKFGAPPAKNRATSGVTEKDCIKYGSQLRGQSSRCLVISPDLQSVSSQPGERGDRGDRGISW